MKTIFKLILIAAIAAIVATPANAESKKAATGFVRLVNAVAIGSGPVSLVIDGEAVRAKGYKFGDVTGGISQPTGARKVTIEREGVEDGVTTVNLERNQTVTLIPFAEKVPASDTKPAYYTIKILRLKQTTPDSGRTVTFVSVSGTPELKAEIQSEDGTWASAFVKRLTIADLPMNYSQGYAPLRVNGESITPIPISGDGNYVLVLYDDAEGKLQSLYFMDFKYLSAD